jgi:glutamate-1-semialdehyde-2,1-aminomutase
MTSTTSTRGLERLTYAQRLIPGGVNSATRNVGGPHGFVSAAGATLVDYDGKEYIDYHAAFGANLLGYGDELVAEAVADAVRTQSLTGLGTSEMEIAVAELTCELIPSVERSVVTMSGTEATFLAVRLARGLTGRDLVVKFQGCFHGWHDAVARNVISPPELAYGMDPMSAGILPAALEATLIAEFNDLASVQALFEQHPGRIAAVILEPVPHNVGALLPTDVFLSGLRSLTADEGAVLVFDEVISGFRHAPGGWQEVSGVMPDLTTYGKAMGNGMPIAGLGGRAELMDGFNAAGGDVLLAGTFNGNPTSCAAAIATMTYLRDHPDFYQRTHRLGERMRSGLREIVGELGIKAHVTGYGGVFVCYFLGGQVRGYRDLMRNDDAAYVQFHRRMTEAGNLMLPLSLKRNHISGAHTKQHIDDTLQAARTVLAGMRAEGICR